MSRNSGRTAPVASTNNPQVTKIPVATVPAPKIHVAPANPQPVAESDIRLHAYAMWEAAGKPDGDGVDFWLEAEQELSQAEVTV